MKNSTVLIVVGKGTPKESLARRLETLRAVSARAAILAIAEVPNFPYYAVGIPPYGSIVVPADWQEEMTNQKSALAEKEQEMEALLQEHNVSGEVLTAVCEPSMISDTVGRRAMLCDVVLIDDALRATPSVYNKIVHGVLFQSPVSVLLNDPDAKTLSAPKRIFVAWNTQLHTARAVHRAMSLLQSAEEVIIGTVDPIMTEYSEGEDPGVDVAKWLTHHGCNVVVQQYPSGGQSVGDCLLARAKDAGADLIIMGSYGHSRAREAFFGGTTRTMIDQKDQAVLLAH